MDTESDYYEEVPSEGEEEAIVPPVVNNEPLGVDIPAPGAESPESPAASPSPVPSEARDRGEWESKYHWMRIWWPHPVQRLL